jgi:hypothetical protein
MVEMKAHRGRHMLVALIIVLVAAGTWAWARSAATASLAPTAVLKVYTSHPGALFAIGAVGLSTEARELDTGNLGAKRRGLVRLMRLLGPSVLRIGGNSVDFSWWTSSGEPPPSWATSTVTPADLSALRGLLAATGWRVLLGVDLGHFEPERAANEARYAQQILGRDLLGIEIGNEPGSYGGKKDSLRVPTYSVGEYLHEAKIYVQTLSGTVPDVALYGPALSAKPAWLPKIGAAGHIFTQVTQHYYPINECATVEPTSRRPTTEELLSPVVRQRENEFLQMLSLAGAAADRPVRIGETNSVACSKTADSSPGFAAALWSLDWILRAESSGVQGLNFHDLIGSCNAYPESPICISGEGVLDPGEIIAQPEYYGLLAARELEGGRFAQTLLVPSSSSSNLTTWATVAHEGTVRIAIDNFNTTGEIQPVLIALPGYIATAQTLVGAAPSANVDVTLGSTRVTGHRGWRPKPEKLAAARGTHSLRVLVRPASAVVITLRPRRSRG